LALSVRVPFASCGNSAGCFFVQLAISGGIAHLRPSGFCCCRMDCDPTTAVHPRAAFSVRHVLVVQPFAFSDFLAVVPIRVFPVSPDALLVRSNERRPTDTRPCCGNLLQDGDSRSADRPIRRTTTADRLQRLVVPSVGIADAQEFDSIQL